MTAIEMLKCPEENNLYFTGDFGFIIKESKIETWFKFLELEGGDNNFVMYPVADVPESLNFIDEFMAWATEKGFNFNIFKKENYKFRFFNNEFVLHGASLLAICDNIGDVMYLTSYMEKFWKHECYGSNGDKVGFSYSKQYFKKGKENG